MRPSGWLAVVVVNLVVNLAVNLTVNLAVLLLCRNGPGAGSTAGSPSVPPRPLGLRGGFRALGGCAWFKPLTGTCGWAPSTGCFASTVSSSRRSTWGRAPRRGKTSWPSMEDDSARLWVGLAGGLAVVERDRVATFSESDGLPAGECLRALARLSDGAVWIGTDNGLSGWRGGRFRPDSTCASGARYRVRDLHDVATGPCGWPGPGRDACAASGRATARSSGPRRAWPTSTSSPCTRTAAAALGGHAKGSLLAARRTLLLSFDARRSFARRDSVDGLGPRRQSLGRHRRRGAQSPARRADRGDERPARG